MLVRGLDEPWANRHIARHIKVRQYLLGNAPENGCGHLPPSCSPTGESNDTRIVTAGLLIGANPVKEAISCVAEYRPVAGSIFCAEPVFPAEVQPSRCAGFPVPFSTTPSMSLRSVAAVSGRITLLGSEGASGPSAG